MHTTDIRQRMTYHFHVSPDAINQSEASVNKIDPLTVAVYTIAVPILVFLCVLAVLANVFILTVSRWIPSQKMKPPLKLTLSLAAADAWTSTVVAVGLLAHSYVPFVLNVPKPRWYDCASYGLEALRLGGMLTSVLHLLALSLTQYFAAAHPHRYKVWLVGCRLRLIHGIIVLLWIAPPSLFFAIFGAYSDRTFLRMRNSTMDSIPSTKQCNADFLDTMGLRLLIFLIVSLPIGFMTAIYMKIFCVLCALRRESSAGESRNRPVSYSQCRYQSRIRRCTKRVITTLLTVLTFLAGWIPAAAVFALTCSECPYPYKELRVAHPVTFFSLMITGNLLMISKGLVNPFIYAVRIPEIQESLKLLLRHAQRGSGNGSSRFSIRARVEADALLRNSDQLGRKQEISNNNSSMTEMCTPKLYMKNAFVKDYSVLSTTI